MLIRNFPIITSKFNKIISNVPAFKGNQKIEDTFETSVDEKKKKYEDAKLKNPRTAFLYNPEMTYEKKVAELKKHPEIQSVQKVMKGFNIDSNNIKGDIFEFDILQKPISPYRNARTINMRYIDTENPLNKETIRRLNEKKKHLFDFQRFTLKYNMPDEIFRRYLKIGRMERFEVYPELAKKKGKHSQIIDETSEKNMKAIANYKKLNPRSKFLDKLLNCSHTDKVYANVIELKEFGIKDFKTIAKAIKEGTIDGIIKEKETPEGKKYGVFVDINSEKNMKFLSAIRKRNCMEIKNFSKKYNIPISEIEDAYFEDKIDFYPKALFPTDWGDQYIDITSERNIDFITKKLIEQQIENQILKKQKIGLDSAKMKIAWYFSPNTRAVARELISGNNYLSYIIAKKERIEGQIQKAEEISEIKPTTENVDNVEETEETIETMTEKEEAVLLGFYKKMWELAGTKEFAEGLKRATQIMRNYKENGIDSIKDEDIRQIILNNIKA